MKKVLLFLIVVSTLNADNYFEFVDNKAADGSLSGTFIQKMVETFDLENFFETGTSLGATTLAASPYFENVYTVELYAPLFQQAKDRLSSSPNVHLYYGNSPEIIESMAGSINGKTLFWLDAHYCGEGTGRLETEMPEAFTAIRAELDAIRNTGINDCVILIDDIRGFGTEIAEQIFIGCWSYPTLQEVKTSLLKINPHFELALIGDTLLAYDQTVYHPEFSQTVRACTKTRLYDGYNLTDEELLDLEEQIQRASSQEAAFITSLYDRMTCYSDPMFWHDLWYGLVQLGMGNYPQASAAFNKVPKRIQSSDKFRNLGQNPNPYQHKSIGYYIEKSES